MKTLLKWFGFSLLLISPSVIFAQEIKKSIRFSVLDENKNFIEKLQASDIQVLQNKSVLKVDSINQVAAKSLDVAIMIDSSASQEVVLPVAKSVANGFIKQSLNKNNDRVAVIKFSNKLSVEESLTNNFAAAAVKLDQITLDMPVGQPITSTSNILNSILSGQVPKSPPNSQNMVGSTSLWDTIKAVVEQVFENTSSRKIIFLLTDGVDTSSNKGSRKNSFEFIRKSQIPVYAVGIGDNFYNGVDEKSLKKLAEETGGLAFVPDKTDGLRLIFKEIEQSARFYYEVGFSVKVPFKENNLNDYKVALVNQTNRSNKIKISQSRPY